MAKTKVTDLADGFFNGQLGGAGEDDLFVTKYNTDIAQIEANVDELHERTGAPEVEWLDGGAPAALGGDLVIKGSGFLQGMTFDTLVLWAGTSAVTINALKPGVSGLTVQITDGATAGAEVVAKTGNAISVQIEVGVSTALQIATAINANAADTDGYVRATSGGAGTTNAVQAATALSGGTGSYAKTKVLLSGVECLPANETGGAPTAKWSDTAITVTVPDLTSETDARAAADVAGLYVQANGAQSRTIAVVLA